MYNNRLDDLSWKETEKRAKSFFVWKSDKNIPLESNSDDNEVLNAYPPFWQIPRVCVHGQRIWPLSPNDQQNWISYLLSGRRDSSDLSFLMLSDVPLESWQSASVLFIVTLPQASLWDPLSTNAGMGMHNSVVHNSVVYVLHRTDYRRLMVNNDWYRTLYLNTADYKPVVKHGQVEPIPGLLTVMWGWPAGKLEYTARLAPQTLKILVVLDLLFRGDVIAQVYYTISPSKWWEFEIIFDNVENLSVNLSVLVSRR